MGEDQRSNLDGGDPDNPERDTLCRHVCEPVPEVEVVHERALIAARHRMLPFPGIDLV